MLLQEPPRTNYDFNFSFLGFPVRVSPWFFLLPIIFAQNMTQPGVNAGVGILLVIVLFFVSVLIHELGHTLAFRYFGVPSYIVLTWMGGLAVPGSGNIWGRQSSRSLDSNQQIVVSLAGPIFGFLISVFLVLFVYLIGGRVEPYYVLKIPFPDPVLEGTALEGVAAAYFLIWNGIALNIFMNLFNLLPVYPLDGGQVAREFFTQMDSRNGFRNSIILSIGAAALIAMFAFANKMTYMAFFFGFMAYSNYQNLNSFGRPRW